MMFLSDFLLSILNHVNSRSCFTNEIFQEPESIPYCRRKRGKTDSSICPPACWLREVCSEVHFTALCCSLLWSEQCAVCSVQCVVFSVQWALYSMQYTVCSLQCTVWRVKCTVWSVQCAVWSQVYSLRVAAHPSAPYLISLHSISWAQEKCRN